MSIRNAEEGRQRQQDERAEKRRKEAEARPDAMHRAVRFLLNAAVENNPDIADEARHHLETLDTEMANPDKVAELDKPAPVTPATNPAAPPPAEMPAGPKPPRASRRFSRT